jgi:hypothetical protein
MVARFSKGFSLYFFSLRPNFDKLDTTDLVTTLECGGVEIDKDKIG